MDLHSEEINERAIEMGYNNNNAGMHLMWYNDYSKYENEDSYYDTVIINNIAREKKVKLEEKNKKTKKKVNEIDKKGEKCKKNKKERVIDDKYFSNTIDLYANIFLIAFEKKLDIFNDIYECERLCEEDMRLSSEFRNYFDSVKVLDKAIVFLNLLADRMECNISEFISANEKLRSERVYNILDRIENGEINSLFIDCAYDYGVSGENDEDAEYVFERLVLDRYMYLDIDTYGEDMPEFNMAYYFDKISKKDGSEEPFYRFIVRTKDYNFPTRKVQPLHFMYVGSEVINETEGKLADFFENTKREFLKSGGRKDEFFSCGIK